MAADGSTSAPVQDNDIPDIIACCFRNIEGEKRPSAKILSPKMEIAENGYEFSPSTTHKKDGVVPREYPRLPEIMAQL